MSDPNMDKMKAAGKVAMGAARVVGGVLTATGHGLLGTYLKKHNMTQQGIRLGKMSIDGGSKMFKEGLEEFKK